MQEGRKTYLCLSAFSCVFQEEKKEKLKNQIHSYLASFREMQKNCALSKVPRQLFLICAKFSKY